MNRWLVYNIVLTLAAYAAAFYLGVARTDLLPENVPIHWNARGEANQFVPRDSILPYFLIMPGFMTFFVLLTLALPWLSPQQFSIERFRKTYGFLMALVLTLFTYLNAVFLASSAGVPLPMNKVLLGGMFLFFALLGNLMGKVQRNFYVGIRTPWTLADETVWVRTHRVGAWVWTAGSVVGFVFVMVSAGDALAVYVSMGMLFFIALFPVIYSLVLYKRLQRQGKLAAQQTATAATEGQP